METTYAYFAWSANLGISGTSNVSVSVPVPVHVFGGCVVGYHARGTTLCDQACLAYRADGGRVVVVLSSRDKLVMEAMFRRTIPEAARYGSTFVFRQVWPSNTPNPSPVMVPTAPSARYGPSIGQILQ